MNPTSEFNMIFTTLKNGTSIKMTDCKHKKKKRTLIKPTLTGKNSLVLLKIRCMNCPENSNVPPSNELQDKFSAHILHKLLKIQMRIKQGILHFMVVQQLIFKL